MKRLFALLTLALLVTSFALPAVAQSDDSVVDALAADAAGRFTTLVAALEIAGLAETLSAEGDYTVFAPPNDAFDAVAETFGVSLAALLGDVELLTEILTYHVVEGERILAADFGENPTPTTLQGGVLTLDASGDAPSVNGVAVSEADIETGNGVYHVIDAVLLTPELAPAPPTPGSAPDEAMLRFAVFALDTPPLVLSVDGEPVADGVAFESPSVGEWLSVPAGTLTLTGTAEDADDEDLLGPLDLTLDAGTWTTLAIVGSAANNTLLVQPVLEDYSPIAPGNARVTVFHAMPGGPIMDVTVNQRAVVSQLAYPLSRGDNDGAFVIEIPAGTVNVHVFQTGTGAQPGSVALVDLPATTFAPNSNSFFAITGTPGRPTSVIVSLDMDEALATE